MVLRVNVLNWSAGAHLAKVLQTLAEKKEGVAGGIHTGQQREQSNKRRQSTLETLET